MSLILRFRRHMPIWFCPKPYNLLAIEWKPLPSKWVHRTYAQATMKAEEKIEIDPRKLPADYDHANFDPTSHRSPPSERTFRLVDDVSSLTLIEVAELSSILMKKMGMNEPPVMGVMKPGAAAGLAEWAARTPVADAKEEKKEEKTVFELKLESFDAVAKLKVIKEIRGCTDLGLKEAKDLVEKAPAVFKTGVSKEEAEKILEKMKAAGAKVSME